MTNRLYEVDGRTGVGFEVGDGTGFFVKTLFVESAVERARQEFASGRAVASACVYENGKAVRMLDYRDFAAA